MSDADAGGGAGAGGGAAGNVDVNFMACRLSAHTLQRYVWKKIAAARPVTV